MTLQKAVHSFLDMLTIQQLFNELGERMESAVDDADRASRTIQELREENELLRSSLGELDARLSALENSINGHETSYGSSDSLERRVSLLESRLGL